LNPPTNPPTNLAAPTGLQVIAGNASSTLTWNAVVGATSYRVYRGTTSGQHTQVANPTGTTFSDTGLTNGTPYYYAVSATDGTKESAKSNEVTVTPSAQLPSAPTGVSASTLNATITISWAAVPDATEYRIYRAATAGGAFTLVGNTASVNYTDTGLTDGSTYYYVVRSVTDEGESTNSQEASATIAMLPAPASVAVARGDGVLSVSWQPVNGAAQYTVFRSTTSGGPYTQIVTRTNTSYVDSGLTNNTTYYYVVRSNNGARESLDSAQASGTPQNLAAPPPSTGPSTEFSSLAGWTTYDGYALRSPGDTANFANISSAASHLSIQIPDGTEHNMWLLRHAAALAPYAGTGIYETKVDSDLTGDQQFGLVFRQTENTFLIFMLYVDPDDQVKAYVERFINVTPDDPSDTNKTTFPAPSMGVPLGVSVDAEGPFHLRVAVTDAGAPGARSWVFSWSPNGIDWTTLIDEPLEDGTDNIGAIASVGVFAGNQPVGLDAFNARFDYFHYFADETDMPAPAPGNLTARGGDNQVELWWDAATSVDGYNVYSASGPAGPFTLVGTTTGTTITDSSAANNSPRSYLVRALRGGFEGSSSQTVTATAHALSEFAAIPTNGLLVALSASELTTLQLSNNDPVTQWPNVLGPQIAARGVLDGAPTFIASGINGKPVVRFNGVDDFLQLPAGFEDFTAGVSIYVVMRPTAAPDGFKVVSLGNGAGVDTMAFGRAGVTAGLQYLTNNSVGAFGNFESSDGFAVNDAAAFSVLQDSGAVDASVGAQIARNGATLTGGAGNVFVPRVITRSVNYIGKSFFPGDGLLQGDIAEVYIYNRKLSGAEDVAIRGYLSAKYSLP
jgi:fibronectin type 3 domain-containing protein